MNATGPVVLSDPQTAELYLVIVGPYGGECACCRRRARVGSSRWMMAGNGRG
jgi:hypothetical protein